MSDRERRAEQYIDTIQPGEYVPTAVSRIRYGAFVAGAESEAAHQAKKVKGLLKGLKEIANGECSCDTPTRCGVCVAKSVLAAWNSGKK